VLLNEELGGEDGSRDEGETVGASSGEECSMGGASSGEEGSLVGASSGEEGSLGGEEGVGETVGRDHSGVGFWSELVVTAGTAGDVVSRLGKGEPPIQPDKHSNPAKHKAARMVDRLRIRPLITAPVLTESVQAFRAFAQSSSALAAGG
jgi:hypothetical protein